MEGCSGVSGGAGLGGGVVMWRSKTNTSVSEISKRISASKFIFYFIDIKGVSQIFMKKKDHAPV